MLGEQVVNESRGFCGPRGLERISVSRRQEEVHIMAKKMKLGIFFVSGLALLWFSHWSPLAQQTLGSITGTVSR